MKKNNNHIFIILFVVLFSCKPEEKYKDISYLREVYSQSDTSRWPKPNLDTLVDKSMFEDIGKLPKEVPHPKDNPHSKAKKKLGKFLFFDGRLSKTGQVSCSSCHNPELAWTDNIMRSIGHDMQINNRNSMTIKNVAFAKTLFWDGRAVSLEKQAEAPIPAHNEMNTSIQEATGNIAKIQGYKTLFRDAFGDEEVTPSTIYKAIATFERSLVSRRSKFDRFVSGKKEVYTDKEVLGMHLFRTKARCINCHNTPYFSDNKFHNDGQTLFGTKNEDLGVFNQTKLKEDVGKFKTPTLREISKTGPWMHHGHFPSLLDVVQLYNLGNPAPIQKKYLGTERDSLIPITSPIIKKLNLTKTEVEALLAFLETLSTNVQRVSLKDIPKN